MIRIRSARKSPACGTLPMLVLAVCTLAQAAPLRIMPVGDSITAGYTDNSAWTVPFEFGYRRHLYELLTAAGYDFTFVGASAEPFNHLETGFGDPTRGGTVSPPFDLRTIGQDGHRGYGGIRITTLNTNIAGYLNTDNTDVILLMIGINGMGSGSPAEISTLVNTIYATKPAVHIILAQITPMSSNVTYAQKNADLVSYNNYIRDTLVPTLLSQGKKVSTVNQYRNFLTDPDNPSSAINASLYSNGINHPTNAAYDTMAQTWFEGLLAVTPPTLPVLDTTRILSSTPVGGTVGNFAQPPAPSTETMAFTLVAGSGDADKAKFTISGNMLRADTFDFAGDPDGTTYSIRVRATGIQGGRVGERVFTLTLVTDSDGDALPDAWEMAKTAPNPNLTDLTQFGDFDNDGLNDTAEYNLSTGIYPDIDPTKDDTDADGLPDGAEVNGADQRPPTNPTLTDTDGDDVCDLNEDNTGKYVSILKTGTNPLIPDTDNDAQPDGTEILIGTNPTVARVQAVLSILGVNSSSELAYSSDASSSDLLNGLTGANAVHAGWYTANGATPEEIHDGSHGRTFAVAGNNVEGGWSQSSGSISTFTLPSTTAGYGWDISGITSIASWAAGAFGNQRYEVGVRAVGTTGFVPLGEVVYQPLAANAGGSTKVQVSRSAGSLSSNVDAIQFTMLTTTGNNGRSVYREIDVFGTQSISPPPSAPTVPPVEILQLVPPTPTLPRSSFTWRSYPGKSYLVEVSENLSNWVILDSAFPSGGVTTSFRHSPGQNPPTRSFYRTRENP